MSTTYEVICKINDRRRARLTVDALTEIKQVPYVTRDLERAAERINGFQCREGAFAKHVEGANGRAISAVEMLRLAADEARMAAERAQNLAKKLTQLATEYELLSEVELDARFAE